MRLSVGPKFLDFECTQSVTAFLLKASQASAIATRKYWSLVVKNEFRTKTIFDAISQMAILGQSR